MNHDWSPGPWPPPSPQPGEVHVWAWSLEVAAPEVAALEATLADDELARAGRFKFERHRRRFSTARGRLRQLLGGYAGLSPSQVEFCYQERGKPYLGGEAAVGFNVSHSHELALCAVAAKGEIGIDVEQRRQLDDREALARRFFSSTEVARLEALPADRREEAFFLAWTRKEAFIKALGEGLSHPLDAFDVSLAPGEPAQLLRIGHDPATASRWSLFDLTPEAGFAAALAAPWPHAVVRCWRLGPVRS